MIGDGLEGVSDDVSGHVLLESVCVCYESLCVLGYECVSHLRRPLGRRRPPVLESVCVL